MSDSSPESKASDLDVFADLGAKKRTPAPSSHRAPFPLTRRAGAVPLPPAPGRPLPPPPSRNLGVLDAPMASRPEMSSPVVTSSMINEPIEPMDDVEQDDGPTRVMPSLLLSRPAAKLSPPPSSKPMPVPTPPPSSRSYPAPPSRRVPAVETLPSVPANSLPDNSAPSNSVPGSTAPIEEAVLEAELVDDVDDEAPTPFLDLPVRRSQLPAPPQSQRAPGTAADSARLMAASGASVPPPPQQVAIPAASVMVSQPAPPPSMRNHYNGPTLTGTQIPSAPDSGPRAQTSSLAPVAVSDSVPPAAQRKSSKTGWLVGAMAAIVAVGALGAAVVLPQSGLLGGSGALSVNVGAQGGGAVDNAVVFVDGQRVCDSLPCEVPKLDDGVHFVKVQADGYEPTSASAVRVESGQTKGFSIDLKKLTASAEAQDTKSESPSTDATASGSDVMSLDQLGAKSKTSSEASSASGPASTKSVAAGAAKTASNAADASKSEKKDEKADKGILRINSLPKSNVIVDGRPLGSTPKMVRVAPGSHSVVFVSPTGRKAQSVSVQAGQSRVVAVRF